MKLENYTSTQKRKCVVCRKSTSETIAFEDTTVLLIPACDEHKKIFQQERFIKLTRIYLDMIKGAIKQAKDLEQ